MFLYKTRTGQEFTPVTWRDSVGVFDDSIRARKKKKWDNKSIDKFCEESNG